MPEAPENRPGHVGHTPQPVGRMLRAARALAIPTDPAAMNLPTEYAGQTLPRIVQQPATEGSLQTVLAIQSWRDHANERQPWPLSFRESLRPGPGTLGT